MNPAAYAAMVQGEELLVRELTSTSTHLLQLLPLPPGSGRDEFPEQAWLGDFPRLDGNDRFPPEAVLIRAHRRGGMYCAKSRGVLVGGMTPNEVRAILDSADLSSSPLERREDPIWAFRRQDN